MPSNAEEKDDDDIDPNKLAERNSAIGNMYAEEGFSEEPTRRRGEISETSEIKVQINK